MKHVVIIGNGISGVTAARNIRKLSNCKITLISAETKYFYSRTALMYIYMGHMRFQDIKPYEDHFWPKNRINLKHAFVEKVESEGKILHFSDGTEMSYDELIIASGSIPQFYNWPGQNLKGVQGLYSWQDLEQMQKHTKNINHAVVVGGGLIGVEMAEMLRSRGVEVSFLVRDRHFWASVLPEEEGQMVGREIKRHGVNLLLKTELAEILGDENGKVRAVVTKSGDELVADFVGLTTGVRPQIEFLNSSKIECNKGVLVNEFLQTNLKGVYAIGDCAEFHKHPTGRKKIEQVWYTGKMMGETVAKTICGNPTKYQPGVWFNSAKFFDLEYQTYGFVSPHNKKEEEQFYWENKNKSKCIRFVYDKGSKGILAIHAFGIRLRHQKIDKWIKAKRPMVDVVQSFNEINFDPEFYPKHEKDIQKAFMRKEKLNTIC